MKMWLRALGLAFIRRIGMKITDAETGQSLGRALFVPWSGKIHVIGLEGNVRPTYLPQARLTYWKQELGFTVYPPPDFPRVDEGEITREKPKTSTNRI